MIASLKELHQQVLHTCTQGIMSECLYCANMFCEYCHRIQCCLQFKLPDFIIKKIMTLTLEQRKSLRMRCSIEVFPH